MRSRKADNKVQITDVSQQLVDNHIMETSVKKDLDEYQTRCQDLDKQVSVKDLDENQTRCQDK